jgi:putative ABC transport system permease protein
MLMLYSRACEHIFPRALRFAKPDRRGESLEKAVSAMHLSLLIMSLLAVTVGVFIIFNSLSVSVNQRFKEIGVLRSIGVEGHRVQKMFLMEAGVLGLVGSALGVGLGFFPCRWSYQGDEQRLGFSVRSGFHAASS